MKNLRLSQVSIYTKERHLVSNCLKKPGEKHRGLLNFQNEIRKSSTVAI